MFVSIRSDISTASAVRSSLKRALQVALLGRAVSGLFVSAMSLRGMVRLFAIVTALGVDPTKIPYMIVGYGFGASFVVIWWRDLY
jgi:K(+)-stimulated pyrophosphate-energized sodium pump